MLDESGRARESFAAVAVGITLVEDVLAVALIAVLTGLASTGAVQTGWVVLRMWRLILFLAVVTATGLLVVPRLLDAIHRFRSDELLVVVLVGLCFGVALLARRLELSLALGAVLIGAIASESRALPRIAALVDPLRHVFSAVFFVTIGLRLDPAAWARHLPVILAAAALTMGGKALITGAGALLAGHGLASSLRVGASLAQVGEFALILSSLALTLGVGRDVVYQVGVGVAVLTTLLNPLLLRAADAGAGRLARSERGRRWAAAVRFYDLWIEQLGRRGRHRPALRAAQRSVRLALLNLVLVSAVFGAAAYLSATTAGWIPGWRPWARYHAVFWWLAAALLSLPLYVVTVRKVDALSLLLAEAALPESLAAAWTRHVRAFIAHIIRLGGLAALAALTFVLSSTLLPSREVFALLAGMAVVGAFWAHRRLSRVYARAQGAIVSMLSGEAPAAGADPSAAPGVPGETLELQPLVLPSAERMPRPCTPRGLRLRTRTGATIVAVERDGRRAANPDPDAEFQPGDRLFLLGTPDQIRAAADVLRVRPPSA